MTDLAFFDVAGTLVSGNPWRGLLRADVVGAARVYGMYPVVLPTVFAAKKLQLLPDRSFRQLWIREMALMLRGLHRERLREMFHWIATEYMADAYQQDVVERLHTHKSNGDHVVLISGMFTEMTQAFADKLGADVGLGTHLAFDKNGRCAGHIVGQGCAGVLKVEVLRAYLAEQDIDPQKYATHAYADSESDVPLLSFADHATATYPEAALQDVVLERGWSVIGEAQAAH